MIPGTVTSTGGTRMRAPKKRLATPMAIAGTAVAAPGLSSHSLTVRNTTKPRPAITPPTIARRQGDWYVIAAARAATPAAMAAAVTVDALASGRTVAAIVTSSSAAMVRPRRMPDTMPIVAKVSSTVRAAAVTAKDPIASWAATIRLMPGSSPMMPPTMTSDAFTFRSPCSSSSAVTPTAIMTDERASTRLMKNVATLRCASRLPMNPVVLAAANATAAVRAFPPSMTVMAADRAPKAITTNHRGYGRRRCSMSLSRRSTSLGGMRPSARSSTSWCAAATRA